MTKSKVVGPHIQLDTLQRFILFALAVARSKKTSVVGSGVVRPPESNSEAFRGNLVA